jgi:GcrA cell cycle regulator
MSWTDERVELLRKLWLEGLSASQIAGELANGITRNAVIGKVHRLGLSGRVKAQAAPSTRVRLKQQQQQPQRVMNTRASGSIIRGNTALALKAEPFEHLMPRQETVVIPMSERVTILDLKESMCRWPHGDPASQEFRYGGAKKIGAGEGPYCNYHSQMAYQPVQERRRERDARSGCKAPLELKGSSGSDVQTVWGLAKAPAPFGRSTGKGSPVTR